MYNLLYAADDPPPHFDSPPTLQEVFVPLKFLISREIGFYAFLDMMDPSRP